MRVECGQAWRGVCEDHAMKKIILMLALFACAACSRSVTPTASGATPRAFDLIEADIDSVHAALRAGTLSCSALVEAYLQRIQRYDRSTANGLPLNSVLRLSPNAQADAAALDAAYARGGFVGPLHCVPVLLKDNYDTFDFPTTAASRSLDGLQPPDDAFTVQRLRAAGAVIIGKATMSEFAFWPQSHNSWTLRVGLPYDTSKDAGGSSSGSAAATAANLTLTATGSDTCASIRLPPSNNALVGVRSSIGLVSQDGIVPLSHFLDVGGPITRTVRDAALMLDAMAAADPADPSTQDAERRQPASYAAGLDANALRGKRIGVLRSYGGTDAFGSDPHVTRVMAQALSDLEAAGATLVDPLDLPDFEDLATLPILYEFHDQIGEYLAGVPNAPRKSLEEIIASGQVHPFIEALLVAAEGLSDTSSDNYLATKAKREPLRHYIEAEMDRLQLDALVYPPVRAAAFGTLVEADLDDFLPDFLANPGLSNGNINAVMQLNNCGFGSSSGMPSIVVPAGYTTDTLPLPIGIEFFGRRWDEARLFQLAYAYEQRTHHRHPPPGFD